MAGNSIIDINFIANAILSFLIVLLFVATYTYITNLENKGCVCAEHSNKKFIKNFSLFAIFYLLITGFIPSNWISDTFGFHVTILYGIVQLIFLITSIVFFFMTLNYTRYLINEKCKCSEDIRREIIMIGSIIEIFIIVLLLLTLLIFPIILAALSTAFKNIGNTETAIRGAMTDPIGSLRKVPKNIRNSTQSISKLVKATSKGVKDVVTKKRNNILDIKKSLKLKKNKK
jgi:hypothetical protein